VAPPVSPVTARAQAFVEARLDQAGALGTRLAELAGEPDALADALEAGFAELADREYEDGQHFIAPGLGPTFGVRQPLLKAVARAYVRATRPDSPAAQLRVADRLLRGRHLELQWLAFSLFDGLVRIEPERTWQLIRRAAREAADWITVDSLAQPCARGILLEPTAGRSSASSSSRHPAGSGGSWDRRWPPSRSSTGSAAGSPTSPRTESA
jgi:hypothetical protein